MKKIPVVDLGLCTKCEGCLEIAPHVFRYNDATGYIEILDLVEYPEDLVEEAMKFCPEDCIYWEEE